MLVDQATRMSSVLLDAKKSASKIASAQERLADQEAEVKEHIRCIVELLSWIQTEKTRILNSIQKKSENIHNEFAILRHALASKEQRLLLQLQSDFRRSLIANDELAFTAVKLISKAYQVLILWLPLNTYS